jgi:hypothetical protein
MSKSLVESISKFWRAYVLKIVNLILNHRIDQYKCEEQSAYRMEEDNNNNNNNNNTDKSCMFNFRVDMMDRVTKELLEKSLKSMESQCIIYIDITTGENGALLERWTLSFKLKKRDDKSNNNGTSSFDTCAKTSCALLTNNEKITNELTSAYLKAIVQTRSLYTYLLLLPAYKLFLKNRRSNNGNEQALLHYNISSVVDEVKSPEFGQVHFSGIYIPSFKATISTSVLYRRNISEPMDHNIIIPDTSPIFDIPPFSSPMIDRADNEGEIPTFGYNLLDPSWLNRNFGLNFSPPDTPPTAFTKLQQKISNDKFFANESLKPTPHFLDIDHNVSGVSRFVVRDGGLDVDEPLFADQIRNISENDIYSILHIVNKCPSKLTCSNENSFKRSMDGMISHIQRFKSLRRRQQQQQPLDKIRQNC